MPSGGYRKHAGRKEGVGNLINEALRSKIEAEPLIQFLNDLAPGKIEGASLRDRREAVI